MSERAVTAAHPGIYHLAFVPPWPVWQASHGLPVSTTHVLSSGVAGTMAANRSGLQADTLRNIILAWVLTLPVCVLLGASIFSFALYLLFHVFGVR
jgi:inorganic phosphate transporter, PiT family